MVRQSDEFAPPILHPKLKMGRNDPCWCLSGKKWKHCHYNRENQEPVNLFEGFEALRVEFAKGYCLHPDAGAAACNDIANAHTIQRQRGLAAIAESNHVLSVKDGMHRVYQNMGQIVSARVGINIASTFPGFCRKHDNEMFRLAEHGDVSLNSTVAFLLSYRALAYELFNKEAAIRSTAVLQQADKGRSFSEQCFFQDYVNTHLYATRLGAQELMALKSRYCHLYTTASYDDFRFYAVKFEDILPVVSCGAISPEYDFAGNDIQNILRSSQPIEHMAFNLTSLGNESVVIFGWVDQHGPAKHLASSFRALPPHEKANATVQFAFEYVENTMIRPSWWDNLSEMQKNNVLKHLMAGHPFPEFAHDKLALSKRQHHFVSSDVVDEIWSG
jgi:hypothetical protein